MLLMENNFSSWCLSSCSTQGPLGRSQGRSDWARFLAYPPAQGNILIPSLSTCVLLLHLRAPHLQIHWLQFHLLSFPPPPYSAAQKHVKASFLYLISNVRSLCFNEPSLNPPQDGFWQERSTSQPKLQTSWDLHREETTFSKSQPSPLFLHYFY